MTNLMACALASEYRALAPYYMNNAARLSQILQELRAAGWRRLADLLEQE